MADAASIPDWIASLSAVGALLGAGFAARTAHRSLRTQSEQLTMLADDARKRQASRVAAWVREGADGDHEYVIRNESRLPVSLVEVWSGAFDDAGDLDRRVSRRQLPPGELVVPVPRRGSSPGPVEDVFAHIAFVDAQGLAWRADARCGLRCITLAELQAISAGGPDGADQDGRTAPS